LRGRTRPSSGTGRTASHATDGASDRVVAEAPRSLDRQRLRRVTWRHRVASEWQILNIVSRGAATYDEIAEALAPFWDRAGTELDPVLDELQGRGLVEPDADGTWTITSTGSSVRDAAGERVGSIRDRLADGITAEQYEQTIAVLSTMAADLEQSPSR
jgi:hypothetical protein